MEGGPADRDAKVRARTAGDLAVDAGTIRALFRYPVKSMAGEAIPRATIAVDAGVIGDRAWAIVDEETGHVASAKHPRKWARLLGCSARQSDDGGVVISLPDGTKHDATHADASARLSSFLGRAVRLADRAPRQASFEEVKAETKDSDHAASTPLALAAPANTFFDFATIHLVTTSSLEKLAELAPSSRFDVARFRPNLVIETPGVAAFVEQAWIGHTVAIGADVKLLIVAACPRCVMTTLAQGELPADPAILRTLAQHNLQLFELLGKRLPSVGVYATVIEPGEIEAGDPVRVLGRQRLRRAGALLRAIKRAVVR